MIDSYDFGEIVINGKNYKNDVIIFYNHVSSPWWRKTGHSLQIEDLDEVIEAKPETLVVGTGCYGAMDIPQGTIKYLEGRSIELIIEKTGKACRIFNQLCKSNNEIVAALHLTC